MGLVCDKLKLKPVYILPFKITQATSLFQDFLFLPSTQTSALTPQLHSMHIHWFNCHFCSTWTCMKQKLLHAEIKCCKIGIQVWKMKVLKVKWACLKIFINWRSLADQWLMHDENRQIIYLLCFNSIENCTQTWHTMLWPKTVSLSIFSNKLNSLEVLFQTCMK